MREEKGGGREGGRRVEKVWETEERTEKEREGGR